MKQFIAIFFALIALSAHAQYATENNIPYTQSTDAYAIERCKLDVYHPTDKTDVPVSCGFTAAA